ncbi:MAG: hypothetical protein IKM61_07205 [Eubacteriaceae bacterium]|nr:hypothetical protein [Eubacteriaceae bacterium]
MIRKLSILFSLIFIIIPLSSCQNIQKYSSDENDSYHISSHHSGGEKSVSCEIEEISAMNLLGSERIIIKLRPEEKNGDKLPYYELSFSDEDKEDFSLIIYSAKAEEGALSMINEGDYDLLESLSMSSSDGNVIIKADCDESLKFKVDENTDLSQIVLHIKEIKTEEK